MIRFVALILLLPTASAIADDTVPATTNAMVQLRGEPNGDAPFVGTLDAGEKVQADPRGINGFFRIIAASGKTGFVAVDVLDFGGAAPEEPVAGEAAPARGTVSPMLLVRPTFVTSPDCLLALVSSDDHAAARAKSLAARQRTATGVMWTSVIVGAATLLVNSFSEPKTFADLRKIQNVNRVALGTIAVGPMIGWGFMPDDGDLLRVAEEWNSRHPNQPLAVP